ncbi:MAG: M23 family metallopeptidase [Candidatus Heimdallarchaeota archaeon]|nr:M23 family metallopeptidase [Candidatus Heimdallarchaeota archaeon]
MAKFKIILIIIIVLSVGFGGVYLYFQWDNLFFDNNDLYEDVELDYMNVVYENQSYIYAFNEGYSSSINCPWGFIHEGIDYFLITNSKVIAAAPGQVENIEWRDNGEGTENRFYARIWIRFNKDIQIGYNFEPWTQYEEDKNQQLSMFSVQVGDWVEIGQEIARFLYVEEGAHIHFDVIENNERSCIEKYFSEEGYDEIMEMIHSFHPTWELCYP